jgi:cell division topological specificity factor
MSFLSFLFPRRKKSAQLAKQRLQAVISAERAARPPRRPDYLPALQRDLTRVVAQYVKVRPRDVRFSLERDRHQAEVLRVKIVLSPTARG